MCRRRLLLLPLVWVVLQACAPALNWRELRWVEDSRWWFPCKPERLDRELPWAGAHVPASMLVCDAQGATWSATAFELPSPAQAQQALAPARQALFDNMRAQTWTPAPMPGGALVAAPWVRLVGQRPSGQPVLAAARWQVRGAWLVQQVLLVTPAKADLSDAAAWPAALNQPALEVFFTGMGPGA
jgi:hypothetical protein